jgi:hypothetical protein
MGRRRVKPSRGTEIDPIRALKPEPHQPSPPAYGRPHPSHTPPRHPPSRPVARAPPTKPTVKHHPPRATGRFGMTNVVCHSLGCANRETSPDQRCAIPCEGDICDHTWTVVPGRYSPDPKPPVTVTFWVAGGAGVHAPTAKAARVVTAANTARTAGLWSRSRGGAARSSTGVPLRCDGLRIGRLAAGLRPFARTVAMSLLSICEERMRPGPGVSDP